MTGNTNCHSLFMAEAYSCYKDSVVFFLTVIALVSGKIQVAFFAYMSNNILISSLSANKTFVYDRVETNVGNG